MRESLALYAGYYRAPRPVDETIELVGLDEQGRRRAPARLSGGQQRRLDVGMALVGDPELLFLDEPTTGFDPSARRQAWETIAGLRDLGKTVFLTTHYMDEAQRLADRVAIIAGGRIVAAGTPADLGDRESLPTTISYRLGGEEVSVQTPDPGRDPARADRARGRAGARARRAGSHPAQPRGDLPRADRGGRANARLDDVYSGFESVAICA